MRRSSTGSTRSRACSGANDLGAWNVVVDRDGNFARRGLGERERLHALWHFIFPRRRPRAARRDAGGQVSRSHGCSGARLARPRCSFGGRGRQSTRSGSRSTWLVASQRCVAPPRPLGLDSCRLARRSTGGAAATAWAAAGYPEAWLGEAALRGWAGAAGGERARAPSRSRLARRGADGAGQRAMGAMTAGLRSIAGISSASSVRWRSRYRGATCWRSWTTGTRPGSAPPWTPWTSSTSTKTIGVQRSSPTWRRAKDFPRQQACMVLTQTLQLRLRPPAAVESIHSVASSRRWLASRPFPSSQPA